MRLLLFLCIVYTSCTPLAVVTVSSDKIKNNNNKNQFIFENDTVLVYYSFWGNSGKMSFDIYNKLDEPIYFDRKNSAYIPNSQTLNYWKDETHTYTKGSVAYGYFGSVGNSSSQSVKEDRIVMIPPKAQIKNYQFRLISINDDIPFKNINYSTSNTQLEFRNYAVISTNEKFEGKSLVIDNRFFVSEIQKTKYRKGNKYKSPDKFYICNKDIVYIKNGHYVKD